MGALGVEMRVFTGWKKCNGYRIVTLCAVWWGIGYFGFSIGPLGLEWKR